jgi:NAD(P)H dehydrogenase (quinone)
LEIDDCNLEIVMSEQTLLVTGASGQLGRQVVELLLKTHTGPIVAATRTPEKLDDLRTRDVIIRRADFDDPDSLLTAFAGVDRLLLISTDAVGEPGRRLQQHRNAVNAAAAAGVNHVIYTSLMNPGPESPVKLAPDHHGTEEALANTTMGWTLLRENLYTESLLRALAGAVAVGKLFSSAGEGKAAYITREDCARASAAALASTFTGRRALDITGPEAHSKADLAALAARLTGHKVDYIPLELNVYIDNLVAAGLPHPVAELIASFDTAIAQGKLSAVSPAVEDLTGNPPTSVEAFLTANRDALLPATR